MIERVNIWYRVRTVREQRLILIMAALIATVFLWLLVIRPLNDALAASRARHADAVIERAEARAQAEALRGLRRTGGAGLTQPVDALIARSAGQAGFQLSRIQPEPGGGVSIAMEAARPQALFAWVAQLEREGVIVSSLSATANADRTVAVQASFRGRAG